MEIFQWSFAEKVWWLTKNCVYSKVSCRKLHSTSSVRTNRILRWGKPIGSGDVTWKPTSNMRLHLSRKGRDRHRNSCLTTKTHNIEDRNGKITTTKPRRSIRTWRTWFLMQRRKLSYKSQFRSGKYHRRYDIMSWL